MADYANALAGGALIGLSVALLMALNGRVAGISGLVARLAAPPSERWAADLAFVTGLVAAPLLFALATGALPVSRDVAALPVLALAGLLVGFGTRLGSGCTSGHGVAGLARLSPRSIAAVVTFVGVGMATVAALRIIAS